MSFTRIFNKLNEIRDYSNFVKINGLELYKTLFNYIDFYNEDQLKKIDLLSEKLEKILFNARKYSLALDIYNFEIDFFQENYTSEKLTAAYKKSMILSTVLESISTRESYEITEDFNDLIRHFEESNNKLQKRFQSLYNDLIFFPEKESEKIPEKIRDLLEENLGNLITENELHSSHFIYYLKNAFNNLEKLSEKYHYQSLTDELTGLNNRRHLYANYPSFIHLAKRQKVPICVMLIDVDDFKNINDNYGHQKGDEVLIRIAEVVKNFVRKSDITIRFGGDEFLLLMYDSSVRTAMIVAESIREEINSIKFKDDNGNTFNIIISIGITGRKPGKEFNDDTDLDAYLEDIIKQADIDLYHAKYDQKNKVNIYNDGLLSIIN